jgi:hypothetical protein
MIMGEGKLSPFFLIGKNMSAHIKILEAIKESAKDGLAKNISLSETSSLTGSGYGKGGRALFDDAFTASRNENPFRLNARVVQENGKGSVVFAAKTGNASLIGSGSATTNPWLYDFSANIDNGSPNIDAITWELPTRAVSVQFPVRSAVLSDVNNLDTVIVEDVMAELMQQEALSMARNNDQSATTTHATGGVNGLRGLDSYTSNSSASAYGSSGSAITNGIHTIANLSISASSFDYDKARQARALLPPQYWYHPSTAWHITPAKWAEFVNNTTHLSEVGSKDGYTGNGLSCAGIPVIINPYLSDAFPAYLACWEKFMTIVDVGDLTIQVNEQARPGFMTIYAMKRTVASVRNPFAGVRVST